MILGLAMTVVALTVAGRRVAYLIRLATAGQPAEPDRRIGGPTRSVASVSGRSASHESH